MRCGPGLRQHHMYASHDGLIVTYLQEAVDEVARQPGLGLLFCAEVLEDVRQLLPVVEGFLDACQPCSCMGASQRGVPGPPGGC